jgi:hypothetical protein
MNSESLDPKSLIIASFTVRLVNRGPGVKSFLSGSKEIKFLLHIKGSLKVQKFLSDFVSHEILDSIVVSIPACHAGDRGSIPRRGGNFFDFRKYCIDTITIITSWNSFLTSMTFVFEVLIHIYKLTFDLKLKNFCRKTPRQ